MPTFVDRVILHASAGNGGHGCASIHREKYKPLGGPDGGNGGRGGNVALIVDPDTTTLLAFHHAPHRRATSGKPGQGSNRDGANGEDMILPVPDGTVVKTEDGVVLADLVGAGSTYIVAQGGRGGLGNAALASPRRKAPGFALLGEPGAVQDVVLELKTVADVALVGFPNAGKSSLVAAMSAARPKIADYPFTTLVPNLGVVRRGIAFTVADVPGLVPGRQRGRGLGLEFLRHVERCSALVHVIDCATMEPDRDPVSDLEASRPNWPPTTRPTRRCPVERAAPAGRAEQGRRARRARPGRDGSQRDRRARRRGPRRLGRYPRRSSRARRSPWPTRRAGQGGAAARRGDTHRAQAARRRRQRLHGDQVGTSFVVKGDRPERWIKQTDFTNDEAVGYLADRLNRLGVEAELAKAGAEEGAEVIIGDVAFDWEPGMLAGSEHRIGPRGTDARLDGR